MRVFQPTWSHPERGGDVRVSARWTAEFRWRGRKRPYRLGLFTDRKASDEAARRIVRLMAIRESGDVPDAEMSRWLEQAPRRIVEYLAKIGILEVRQVASSRTLDEHILEFKMALAARGNSPKWVELVTARARAVLVTGCRFRAWTDITAGPVEKYLALRRANKAAVGDKPPQAGMSIQTSNFCLAASKQFCGWMVEAGRATANPLAHVKPLNVRVDRRHDRRAFTLEELRYLLEHVGNGPEYQNIIGPERAMLYRTAAETGLRANELRTLTRGSLALGTAGPGGPFPLAASGPTIRVGAAYSKRRREDVVPLRPDTAAALAAFVATKAPAAAVFKMPPPCGLVRMLKADLESARAAWVNGAATDRDRVARRESEFLVYRDREGRVADFHAFRHTFITNLITAGVHPHTAQKLARHSTITLTMDRYGHLLRGAETDALAALPSLSGLPAPRSSLAI